MYTILVIITSKWKITTLLVLRKGALKDEKCIMSDVRDCDTKVLLYGWYIIIFIPSHFRQIKDVLTSIFK